MKRKILLVDGYNMIASWQATKQLFKKSQLDEARTILLHKLSTYASFEGLEIICVFDAQHVPGLRQRYDEFNVTVIFTQEEETADSYIESLAAELNNPLHQVSVATSDLNEQWTVFAQGALRVSARELEKRACSVKADLTQLTSQIDLATPPLRPWNDQQLAGLANLLEELGDS